MGLHVDSCCFGCSLKTGSVIIGVINTIQSFVGMGLLIYIRCKMEPDDIFATFAVVGACIGGAAAIIGILLVIGSIYKIPALLQTWVICQTIALSLVAFREIMALFVSGAFDILGFIGFVTGAVLTLYFIAVVNSYRTELKKGPTVSFQPLENYQPEQANVV